MISYFAVTRPTLGGPFPYWEGLGLSTNSLSDPSLEVVRVWPYPDPDGEPYDPYGNRLGQFVVEWKRVKYVTYLYRTEMIHGTKDEFHTGLLSLY